MASQTQGIQQLLAAEKKAAEKVQAARKRKAIRLKQAKDEATAEIQKFKAEREIAFREYETKHMGSRYVFTHVCYIVCTHQHVFLLFRDDVASQIEQETKNRLETMNKNVSQNKDQVIKDLLHRVIGEVKPELHRNLRLG